MPIRKFHSVEEMTPLPDRRPFDPEDLRIAIVRSRLQIPTGTGCAPPASSMRDR